MAPTNVAIHVYNSFPNGIKIWYAKNPFITAKIMFGDNIRIIGAAPSNPFPLNKNIHSELNSAQPKAQVIEYN